MAICKSFSSIKITDACNEEKQTPKSSKLLKASTALCVIFLGICAFILVLYVKTTYQLQNLMEQVSNLSTRLRDAEKYQWNNTDALLSFERMLNETKGDGVIEYSRHAQINREGQGLKRFLSGFSNMELLSKNLDSGVTAVHYIPHEYKDISQYNNIKCSGSCCHVWSGTFCANQTFLLNDPLHGVQFFTSSPWMTSQHIEEVEPLVQNQTDTSIFSVTKSGLHLLYLNILVQATKSSHDIAIYIDGTRKLDCRESLDYVRSDPSNPYMFSKGKTCSVSGVFFLQRSSDLSIRILTSQTAVILKPENTNFGAILLKT
uniref:TNF family profile domain-containing protein n=1 Tax=Magallana gigas TaxID=29159 RepID=A0A8W8IQY3_MAGGI|nr:uncharacterized protein LOC105343079 [Crassostrea gigas]